MSIVRGTVHPNNLYQWLAHIRPNVYSFVREPTPAALQDYVHGYLAALSVNRVQEPGVPPFGLFLHWLPHRLRASGCAYGWAHVLTKRAGSHEAALDRFFTLAAEYGSLKPVLVARRVIPPEHCATEEYRRGNPAHALPTAVEIHRLHPSKYHFVRDWYDDWSYEPSPHPHVRGACLGECGLAPGPRSPRMAR